MKYLNKEGVVVYTPKKIIIGDRGVINPTHEMLLEAGYTVYVEPVYVKTLDDYKRDKIAELYGYDKSSEVNIFYYQNIPMWLPLEQRNNLLNNSIPACESAGEETIYLALGDIALYLEINLVKAMLLQVEYYAKKAFDATDKHKRAIEALKTIKEVKAYDFTVGYPEKVRL